MNGVTTRQCRRPDLRVFHFPHRVSRVLCFFPSRPGGPGGTQYTLALLEREWGSLNSDEGTYQDRHCGTLGIYVLSDFPVAHQVLSCGGFKLISSLKKALESKLRLPGSQQDFFQHNLYSDSLRPVGCKFVVKHVYTVPHKEDWHMRAADCRLSF
jgi:hypothetical protein